MRNIAGESGRRPSEDAASAKRWPGQGPRRTAGELDYVIGDAMIGGFALIATPAEYGVTGVQTLIVNHDGIVYQKDLGRRRSSATA